MVRSQTLSLRARGFVDSAKGFGARPFYVIRRHLAPALGPIIGAQLVYVAGDVVIIEAALSFLGLGDPAVVSWGADIRRAGASPQIALNWLWLWWLLPLGLALSFAVFGFSLIGVGLEPEFNPRVANA
jgi:peptide/nickel transport system permease protein